MDNSIKKLDWDKKYHFRIIAINSYGVSGSSPEVTAKKTENELPPVIWKTIPADGGFSVGYSATPKDFLYDIEYGTRPGNYSRRLVLKNKGVLHVPGLKNGQTYYFRLRSRKQWGFKSEWTAEESVIPDGGLPLPAPTIHGMVKNGKDAIVYFDPVPKATGYEILIQKKNGAVDSTFINGSDINYAEISNVESADTIYMKAINQYEESDKSIIPKPR